MSLRNKFSKHEIVLVNPTNPDPAPNYFGPAYGISLIAASLLKNHIPVSVYDFDLEPVPVMLKSFRRILKTRPRYIGITIQSCTRGPVYELIKTIKDAAPLAIIILGGPFATDKYEFLLKHFPVDYIVIGEGEQSFLELVCCLKTKGGDISAIDGIAYRQGRKVLRTEDRRGITDLDSLPYPAFHLFSGFQDKINCLDTISAKRNFILGKRCTSFRNALLLLSSRGCVYSCNFCPMSKVIQDKMRFHSPEYFVAMVAYFHKKFKIKNFVFGDNFFTRDRRRVIAICKGIMQAGLTISWTCMTRSDSVDAPLLAFMAQAGCFEISYGLESASGEIQRSIGKNLDLIKSKKALKLTARAGIRTVLMLMVGNLGETEETIRETAYYVRDCNPDNLLVNIVKVYPMTRIHDIFEERGLLPKKYYLGSNHCPPAFTLEHSEKKLKELSNMIKPRMSIIQISNTCNNNCAFCSLVKESRRVKKSLKQIKSELELVKSRGEYVVLAGAEPLLRKDMRDILRYCDELEMHNLFLYTNARMLSYPGLVKVLNGFTSLEKVIIPFFGLGPVHDQISRVPGSFRQAITGIRNIRENARCLSIQADIVITNANLDSLFECCSVLLKLGVDELHLVFVSNSLGHIQVPKNALPAISEVMRQLQRICVELPEFIQKLYFEGFPLCSLAQLRARAFEPYRPFDEVITLGSALRECSKQRLSKKRKFKFCASCKENGWCEGVWSAYARKYGTREFHAL
ncbi:MAG: radical SAM protein [Candidatus Omnitrophota bacterium]